MTGKTHYYQLPVVTVFNVSSCLAVGFAMETIVLFAGKKPISSFNSP
jgi:hypothetical protein